MPKYITSNAKLIGRIIAKHLNLSLFWALYIGYWLRVTDIDLNLGTLKRVLRKLGIPAIAIEYNYQELCLLSPPLPVIAEVHTNALYFITVAHLDSNSVTLDWGDAEENVSIDEYTSITTGRYLVID